jgi:uncharacterized delta-60 repeat protein
MRNSRSLPVTRSSSSHEPSNLRLDRAAGKARRLTHPLFLTLVSLLLISSSESSKAAASAGDLDLTFGSGGKVTTNFFGDVDFVGDIAIQPEGKIVAVGAAYVNGRSQVALARYNANGSLDTSFGSGGKVSTVFLNATTFSRAEAVVLQPDGKIVIALQVGNGGDFGVARYNADGSLDQGFGSGGKLLIDFFGFIDSPNALALQPDGKIIVAGLASGTNNSTGYFALARLNGDGGLDASFGSGGKATVHFGNNIDWATDVALQPDGKIVVVGVKSKASAASCLLSLSDFGIVRFNSNGSLDTNFGAGGTLGTDFFGLADSATAVVIQPDNKLVVVGHAQIANECNPARTAFAVARYNSNGSLDQSFGSGGKVVTTFSGMQDQASDAVLLPDGKLVVAGSAMVRVENSTQVFDFGVARYNSDGSPDNTFGASGKTTTDFLGVDDQASAVALHGGNILVAGHAGWHINIGSWEFALARYLNGGATPPSVQFSAPNFSFAEGAAVATVTVTRTGDTGAAGSVSLRTVDNPAAVPCDPTKTAERGTAYARCDYATTVDTVTFAPGETQKSVNIPLIDDAHVEGSETFQVSLSSPSTGTTLGAQPTSVVTIEDNDAAGQPNPILTASFFVRMHYLDFLSREPEQGEPWSATLNNCRAGDLTCDRVSISAAFFNSQEFRLKGFFVFNFYRVSFDRLPAYDEIIPDMRTVTGSTPGEVYAKRALFADSFTRRTGFLTAYPVTMTSQQYVDALMGRYSLQQITTPDPSSPDTGGKVVLTRAQLAAGLDGSALTRAQVLRAVVQSDEVGAAESNRAFVAMQYYGYLRRAPEPGGYQAWLDTINADPSNIRDMVNGFMNSAEYRRRFGPQ